MASNTSMDDEQAIRECEAYVQDHNIQQILKDCIVQLCVCRPANPITFLREHFQKLEKLYWGFFIEKFLNRMPLFNIETKEDEFNCNGEMRAERYRIRQ